MSLTVEASRVIDAPLSRVWEIVSDLGGYERHTDTLTETTVVSGAGGGVIRRCVDASGNHWEETCTTWDPERRYVMDVDVSTYPTKYRMLFQRFRGTWSVEPVESRTRVTIKLEADLRRIPGVARLTEKLAERSASDLDAILESYAEAATTRSERPSQVA
jgi:ribosome-associated toxin RatA of RatAB toxin-antitoxin module